MVSLEENAIIKVLGMQWNTADSTLQFQTKPWWNGKYTKRMALSFANQLYDPLGWMVPIEIKMRLFIQELWRKNYSWEQSFEDDQDLMKKWEMLSEEYEISQKVILPRSTCNADKANLHVFCDASKHIYGAAVYIVPIHYNTKPQLVLAKAKIIGINKEPKN